MLRPRSGGKKKGRPLKYTREFLLSVPRLMTKMSLKQIAATVNGNPTAIVELCYRHKIVLPSRRRHRVFTQLRFSTIARMQEYAATQGLTYNELAEKLLEVIAQEDMFKAVLDD